MNARVIPRTAVGGYLKLIRLPFDAAVSLLPGNGTGSGPSLALALDRAEASARAVAGAVLGDPVLREDATRRRAAADERERALRLRTAAEHKTERADEHLSQRQEGAERRRAQARERAQSERDQARRRRE